MAELLYSQGRTRAKDKEGAKHPILSLRRCTKLRKFSIGHVTAQKPVINHNQPIWEGQWGLKSLKRTPVAPISDMQGTGFTVITRGSTDSDNAMLSCPLRKCRRVKQ